MLPRLLSGRHCLANVLDTLSTACFTRASWVYGFSFDGASPHDTLSLVE